MHILYLSQYFPPEVGATQARAHEMASHLVRAGHRVTVICEIPNHPSGIIPPAYRGKLWERSRMDGIDVIRVWVKTSPTKNLVTRLAFYISYMVLATLAGLFPIRDSYHLIYASSPPLFVGGTALILSLLRRIPMVFEVRDLWPESALALGELTNQKAVAWATWLEEACYRRAKKIVVVTQGILDRLIGRSIPPQKIVLIPNGANIDRFQFRPQARSALREQLGLTEKVVALYAGIHGVAQGLETVIEAAHYLQEDPSFHFLMVGEGPRKSQMISMASRYRLENITFLEEQPQEHLPDLLSATDIALVPLRRHDLFRHALPTKMFDAWACQRPVLLGVDGEARSVLEQAQGGCFIPPENPILLAKALRFLKENPHLREKMGRAGRLFTAQHFSRKAQAAHLCHLLNQVYPGTRSLEENTQTE